jgi:LAS superfamily LD-carboxypeptidase LdcB
MDNNIDEVMQRLALQLENVVGSLTKMSEVVTSATTVTEKSAEQEEKDLKNSIEQSAGYTRVNGKLVKQEELRIELEARLNKELEQQFGAGKLRAERQESAFNSQLKQLNYMITSNGKLAKTTIELNATQQKQINTAKQLAENEEKRLRSKDNIIPELKKGLLEIGKASWGVATNLAKGETSFTTLFPLMDTMANAVGSVGKNLLGMIPIIGGFTGALFDASTKIALEGSKFLIEMLEKSVKDFQEMGNAGALIAGGMTALNDQILESGMTTEGFKKVVKESAKTLVAWQGTVGEGARKFAGAMNQLSLKGAGDELRRLGLTADDMGESAAAFLEQEIRLGRGRNMTQKQLTEGTVQYAKELDLLSKVTGLSRQDAQKQRDELLSDSRYRASIEGMNEDNQKALNNLMMMFKDPNLKRGLMDLASGAITSKDAGMVTTAFGDTAAEAIQSLKDARPQDIPKLFDKIMLDFQESAKTNKEMFGEAYKYLEPGTMINAATIFDIAAGKHTASMEKAKEAQDAQIKNTDKLTENTIDAQKNMELLSREMRILANDQLPKASEAVAYFTKKLYEAVSKIFEGPVGTGTTIVTASEADKNIEKAEKKLETSRRLGDKEAEKKAQQELDAARNAKKLGENARRNRTDLPKGTGEPVKPNKPSTPVPGTSTTPTPVPGTSTTPTPVPGTSPAPTPVPSTNPNKKTAAQLLKFGSGSGDKAHFDMLNPSVSDAFMKMIEEYGKPVQITSAYRSYEEQKALWDKARAGPNPDVRIQDNGIPVARPGTSKHEQRNAIDLSKPDALEFYNTTRRNGSDLLNKYGFNYDPIKDAVHFEKARFGGSFDGPESGYPVILHGEEVAMPKPQFDELANNVKKESITTAFKDSTNMSTSTSSDSSSAMLQELIGLMEDKFDAMIAQLSTGNDIQSRLLNNSMV